MFTETQSIYVISIHGYLWKSEDVDTANGIFIQGELVIWLGKVVGGVVEVLTEKGMIGWVGRAYMKELKL